MSTGSFIKISTMNCRGLHDNAKRKDVMNFLRKEGNQILCLQDTHFTKNEGAIIRAQWGGDHFFSPGRTNARGVSTFFDNSFEYKVLDSINDDVGNYLALKILIGNQFSLSLINIYGPNNDSPEFYHRIAAVLDNFTSDFVLICGDWNLVQDPCSDSYNYTTINNPKSREYVFKLKNDFNLVDPWRIYNPDIKKFTWHRRNPIKMSRLDFFLISEELLSRIEGVKIINGYRTDHSIVQLSILISDCNRGAGFWKFNTSLLKDPEYVTKVKQVIHRTVEDYSLDSEVENTNLENVRLSINDDLFLEILLLKIREMTIQYSSHLKKIREREVNCYRSQIECVRELYEESKNTVLGIFWMI